jgi:hypothetical protein
VRIVAGVIAILTGLGFGIPGILGARYFAQHNAVWTFMGFPTYGGGPFERFGLQSSVPLLVSFVVVSALEVILGTFMLFGVNGALWSSLALLPIELAYWYGFALPLGFVFGLLRTIAVIIAL